MILYARLEYFQIGRGHSAPQRVSAECSHDHPDHRRDRTGDHKKSLHDLLRDLFTKKRARPLTSSYRTRPRSPGSGLNHIGVQALLPGSSRREWLR